MTRQDSPSGPRWVALDGAHNVRDLGGLAATKGRTRHGILYRSDSLDCLTPADVHTVSQRLRVRTVVDLRGRRELPTVAPTWWHDGAVRRVSIPLLDDAALDAAGRHDRWTASDLSRMYQAMLVTAGPSLVAVLDLVTSPGATPVLLHCAAGKDRTGVATAVLLAAAGVELTAIVADYLATNERIPRVLAALSESGYVVPPNAVQSADILQTPASVMSELVEQLYTWPDGAAGYLLAHGANPAAVSRWCSTLLDDAMS